MGMWDPARVPPPALDLGPVLCLHINLCTSDLPPWGAAATTWVSLVVLCSTSEMSSICPRLLKSGWLALQKLVPFLALFWEGP